MRPPTRHTPTTLKIARRVLPKTFGERLWSRLVGRYDSASLISRETRAQAVVRRLARRRPRLHHLDIHLADHCNLNCRSCEHYSCIAEPSFADLVLFERDLARLAEVFEGIDQVYLLGGEPLLHPQVAEFVRSARRFLPDTRVCLMTNGVLLPRMDEPFWDAMRGTNTVLLCDDYPGVVDRPQIDVLGAEHGVNVEWMAKAEQFFRAPIDLAGTCDPSESFVRCTGLSNCAIIKDGRLFPCAHIAYADILRKRFGIEGLQPTGADSVSIYAGATGDEIIDVLTSPRPWCAHCDYAALEYFPWSRTERSLAEWVRVDEAAEPSGDPGVSA